MSEDRFDLIVIGGGPGGYVAALRAAQLGRQVAVVELRDGLGGVCLHEGCIPSKTLLDASEHFARARDRFERIGIDIDPPRLNLERMLARKNEVIHTLAGGVQSLFKKHGIRWVKGRGRLAGGEDGARRVQVSGGEDGELSLSAERVLLATGSRAVALPGLPFDDERIVHARGALAFETVPQHLLVVGGGYIGLELGSVWRRLGAEVTVVEALPELLPAMDRQLAQALQKALQQQGLAIRLETRVDGVERNGETLQVKLKTADGEDRLDCDHILVAAGRQPWTEDLGLEEAGVELTDRGRVRVDEDFCSSVEGVYAIGDLIDGPMLAHKAMDEGVAFAERWGGQPARIDYDLIPGVVYTHPEGATVGRTEEQLQQDGISYSVGRCPFGANGRARAMDEAEGFVKILAHADTGRVLGVHILGPQASHLIAEAVAVMAFGGSAQDIQLVCHAHPTLAEAVKEAALAVDHRSLHA